MRITYHLVTKYADSSTFVQCLTCGKDEADRMLCKLQCACKGMCSIYLERV
jgi:hypothetical protein